MSDIVGHNESLQIVACSSCKHYIRVVSGPFQCKAFDSIPKGVINSQIIHNKVLPGQKGKFVYEWDGEGLRHPKYK